MTRKLTARQGRAVITKAEKGSDSGCEFACHVCDQAFPGDQVIAVAESWRWWRPESIAFECVWCHTTTLDIELLAA